MTSRLIAAVLAAGALTFQHGDALRHGDATKKEKQAAGEIEIPQWKLDLVTGTGDDWWITHVASKIKSIQNALWGTDLPDVTASPAQDHQTCPVLKLPASFYGAAKYSSWRRLYGEWSTGNDVTVATFEQNYLMMGFSRDVKQVSVLIRTAATGQVAIRTRPYTDEQMMLLFNWKATGIKSAANGTSSTLPVNGTNGTALATANGTALPAAPTVQDYTGWNLAIFDCVGTLMYVVKEKSAFPAEIQLYSRDGTLVSSSHVGHPVLRYQFVDPSSGYLISTAEAPGINASISRTDIPKDVQVGDVLPFGFKFEEGGYTNSSALMENEYRWVLATAVQSLAIYNAEGEASYWTVVTVVEAFLIACIVLSVLLVGGLFFCVYRLVFPGGHYENMHYYGRLAENPFLAHKDASLLKPRASRQMQELGWHSGANGYGAPNVAGFAPML
jgi:hypothetical protein